MKNFNFAFWGTPSIASETLEILKKYGYVPSVIITSPDKPSGRGLEIKETPVSFWAKDNNVHCLKPEKIDDDFINKLSSFSFDLNIVVAYGKILPENLINIPKFGTINIHYSLLPKYRGASPLEATLLNGDETTGVSIQQMAFKLDSGPIIAKKIIPIKLTETKEDLKQKLVVLGGNLISETLPKILEDDINPEDQDESKASYCKKISKIEGEINLNSDDLENYNKYRAFYGWPGLYFFIERSGRKIRIKIKHAVYTDGKFLIKTVVPEGKKEISYDDFLKQINT